MDLWSGCMRIKKELVGTLIGDDDENTRRGKENAPILLRTRRSKRCLLRRRAIQLMMKIEAFAVRDGKKVFVPKVW